MPSKPKQYRWVCPLCSSGKLAPSRPRKDDVRRFCLPCSERTGRLVERLSPALERARRERAERRKTKDKRKKAGERKRRQSYCQEAQERRQDREAALGLPKSLQAYVRQMARLKTWRQARLEDVKVKIRWGDICSGTGHAKLEWWYLSDGTQITVTLGRSGAGALALLLHEFAHHAAYRMHGERDHGEPMKRLLIDATEELTGMEVDAVVDGGHCYTVVDPPCQEAIKAWLAEGGKDEIEGEDDGL